MCWCNENDALECIEWCLSLLICLHACVSACVNFALSGMCVSFPYVCVYSVQCRLVCAAVCRELSVLINRDVAQQVSSIIASCQRLCVCSPLDNATWESLWCMREWSCLVATVKQIWGGARLKEQNESSPGWHTALVLCNTWDGHWTHHNSDHKAIFRVIHVWFVYQL